jgi:hypothetical protein
VNYLKIITILAFLGHAFFCEAQVKGDFQVMLGGGAMAQQASGLTDSHSRGAGYGASAHYFVGNRHLLVFDFVGGYFNYYVPQPASPTARLDNQGDTRYQIFSALYKYRVVNFGKWGVNVGAGLSLGARQSREWEYQMDNNNNVLNVKQVIDSGMGPLVPVRVELGYKLRQHWALALEFGKHYVPRSPNGPDYIMLKLGYVFSK